ncbi:MAG TPA: ion channel [Vicinamibacteria bacterium]|nr:ion channel [Vicinamibacteria bacterium]
MASAHGHRWPAVETLTRFWADDRGLSVFSALLLIVAFVIPPLLPPGSGRSLAGDVVYALLLISGVRALGERRLARVLLMPVAVVTLAVNLGSWVVPVAEPWVLGTRLLSLVLFLAVVLAQTLRSGPITFHRLHGAVAAYLLLGVIWAHAYALVGLLRSGAFSGPVSAADGPRAFFYFSFVTLATVGYGDVLPVHPAARSLATLEAVTGTLYLAILIARLVSVAVAPGRNPKPDA